MLQPDHRLFDATNAVFLQQFVEDAACWLGSFQCKKCTAFAKAFPVTSADVIEILLVSIEVTTAFDQLVLNSARPRIQVDGTHDHASCKNNVYWRQEFDF